MISAKLPFRQMAAQYRKLFPQYDDMLLVVVDAPTAEASRDGAKKLLSGLRARTDLFRDVYYPAGDPFLESHGLLYQEPAELNALADKITAAQPFLALLARDPSLAGLAGLLGKALEAAAHGQAMDLEPLLRRVNAGLEALSQNKPYSLSWQELMQGKDATLNDRRQLIDRTYRRSRALDGQHLLRRHRPPDADHHGQHGALRDENAGQRGRQPVSRFRGKRFFLRPKRNNIK